MGVTGSGKTFTMANVIQQLQRPTLVLSHNKTLAAQLYSEFKEFFPHNAVSYFVSYYDYYQPEAYIPQRDIYIEKDASINEEIDRMRLATTSSLVSRRDVIVVASVSCIYGLGSPEDYKAMMVGLKVGDVVDRDTLLGKLVDIQYERNDTDPSRGKFRVRGDSVEVWPSYEEFAYRIEFWGDEIERLSIIDPTSSETIDKLEQIYIYPAKHFVLPEIADRRGGRPDSQGAARAAGAVQVARQASRSAAAQRADAVRLRDDARDGLLPGHRELQPAALGPAAGRVRRTRCSISFRTIILLFIDESHATVPQIGAMYAGDRNRKVTLVEHGFRLPSALDNRPLKFEEWRERVKQAIYVSATPGKYELEQTGGEVIEQVVRPTGLLDPVIEVIPARGQVPHLLGQIRERAAAGERMLVTTLTKRLAEDLSDYFTEQGVLCKWLHSELDAFERVELLRDLRKGKFDALWA